MKKGQESGPKLNVQDIHFLTGKASKISTPPPPPF
jgi:hypothetical protein